MTNNMRQAQDLADDSQMHIEKISEILDGLDVETVNYVMVNLLVDFCINYVAPDKREEWLDRTTSLLRAAFKDLDLHTELLKSECSGNA